VVSMLGLFKNIALFSFIVPIIVLAVPIFDTIVAIVRRMRNKENIMTADNKHLHYRLMDAGYSHRTAVLIFYLFSAVFSVLSILFSTVSTMASIVVTLFVLVVLHILAELAGIVMGGKRPVVNWLRSVKWKISKQREH